MGWRPVAATHRSILALPQRILTKSLLVVMETLKEFHAKEFKITGIRRFWIVENSLGIILSLLETLTSMYLSDIDSMYQKMNQDNVIEFTAKEMQRAATIIGADRLLHCYWRHFFRESHRSLFLVQYGISIGSF
jgi:hypothetical protein